MLRPTQRGSEEGFKKGHSLTPSTKFMENYLHKITIQEILFVFVCLFVHANLCPFFLKSFIFFNKLLRNTWAPPHS